MSYEDYCQHSERFSSPIRFTLNPLNRTGIIGPYTSEQPSIQWEAQQSDMFTLLLVNTANGQLNYAVINIRGNNINTGQVQHHQKKYSKSTHLVISITPKGYNMWLSIISLFIPQVIQSYKTPINYRKWITPFVFMLFKQDGSIQLDSFWQQQFTQDSRPVDLYNFQYNQRLTGRFIRKKKMVNFISIVPTFTFFYK